MTRDSAGLRNLLAEAQPISPLPQQHLLLTPMELGKNLAGFSFSRNVFYHWPTPPAPILASILFPTGRAASILKKPAYDTVEPRAVFSTLVRQLHNLRLTRGSFLTDRNHSHELSLYCESVSVQNGFSRTVSTNHALAKIPSRYRFQFISTQASFFPDKTDLRR